MTCALDVNVLVYASLRELPQHAKSAALLQRLEAGPELLAVPWPVLTGYLRIATSSRIASSPLAPAEAEANVTRLLELGHVRAVSESDGFWESYRAVTAGMPTRGRDVPDAVIAAILHEHGVSTLWTADAGFRRFAFLEIRNPLD